MPLADDRVAFPVAGALLLVNGGGALGDVAAVRDAAPPGGIPPPCNRRLRPRWRREDVELAAAGAVLVDPLVEPGEADRDDAAGVAARPAICSGLQCSSSKARTMFQTASRQLARARRRQAAALLGLALGLLVAVAGLAGVQRRRPRLAAQLAADSRFVASQLACDLADRDPLICRARIWQSIVVLQMPG